MKQHKQQLDFPNRCRRIDICANISPQIEILTAAEMQSVRGGITPLLPGAILDYIISNSKKCQYDPDSAKLPCSD